MPVERTKLLLYYTRLRIVDDLKDLDEELWRNLMRLKDFSADEIEEMDFYFCIEENGKIV